MKKPIVFILGTLLLTVAGFAIGRLTAPLAPIVPEEPAPATTRIDGEKETQIRLLNEQIAALRKREADLKERLAAQEADPEEAPVQAEQPEPPQPRRAPPTPAEMLANLERLKTEDPELHAQIMQRYQRLNTEIENRADFFSRVDTSLLTAEQRETHAAFLEKFNQVNELRQKLENGEGSFQEIGPAMRELNDLRHAERDILLQAAGRSAGYNNQESEAFAATIKEIYQVTDMPRGPGGPGGFGGRGGGRRR